MFAKNFMDTSFHTLHPRQNIAEAFTAFQKATKIEGKKIFGMMVTDDEDKLVGMLSMYDILLFVQPRHAGVWQDMAEAEQAQAFGDLLGRVKSIQVGDLMTPDVVTIKPQTHLMAIMDIMLKRHIRRLPVVSDTEVVGIVYISDLFYHLLQQYLTVP